MKHLESSLLIGEKDQPVPPLAVPFGTRVLAFVAGSLLLFEGKCVGRCFCIHRKLASNTFNKRHLSSLIHYWIQFTSSCF